MLKKMPAGPLMLTLCKSPIVLGKLSSEFPAIDNFSSLEREPTAPKKKKTQKKTKTNKK